MNDSTSAKPIKSRWRMKIISRRALMRLACLALLLGAGGIFCTGTMLRMPGESHRGALPPLTENQRELATILREHVEVLAGEIGPRNVWFPRSLRDAEDWIEATLRASESESAKVTRQDFEAAGMTCSNFIFEIPGSVRPEEIVVVGAHYDTHDTTPGADDNGSGTAGVLALARRMRDANPDRTLRFVLFVNEEPPFFQTEEMGSLVYARSCRARNENIIAMISLEMLGYYSDLPDSQHYPISALRLWYPTEANFIGFVGNYSSRKLVRESIKTFRSTTAFPSEGAALPGWIEGVGWSDHWAFWQEGYSAIMITDTALFRSPHYHQSSDAPQTLDYERMARVVEGIEMVLRDLARATR